MPNGEMPPTGSVTTPHPDPTFLTTEQLKREIENLREFLEASIKAETNLTDARFKALAQQNEMVEKQRIEQKGDVKAAVDAALAAQKEAVKEQTLASERSIAKSEAATTKQLEQIIATFSASIGSVSLQLNDAKDRLYRLETTVATYTAATTGAAKGRTEGYGGIVTIIMLAAVVITLILKFVGA